jgi:hypothetical protein
MILGTALLTLAFLSLRAHGQAQLTPAQVQALPECSLSKTNDDCQLTIDRASPLTPPAVQMYSDKTVTVIVKNPKTFERYFLDYQTGQATLSPDIASSIVQGLLPGLGKVNGLFTTKIYFAPGVAAAPADPCAVPALTTDPLPGPNKVATVVPAFQKCLEKLAADAVDIYGALEPLVAPDSRTPSGLAEEPDPDAIQGSITDFLNSEIAISSRITNIAAIDKIKNTDGFAVLQLSNLQKIADVVAADLTGYSERITDYWTFDNGFHDCKTVIDVADDSQCIWISSGQDKSKVYRNMVTRTITYSLNTLNLISNSQEAVPDPTKKKLLASIAINFADTTKQSVNSAFRWEASAGAFFSSLPVRSFSVAPVFTAGMITDKKIAQNVLHPTVVPFAAGNYRLTNDLKWSRWKSNIYWTGAVGINPNTVTADFATGLSLSWRALMVSGLCHFGHGVRLTQGLTVGESLGAGFNGSIPTQTYWTESFAIGLSIRVPSLIGR